MKTHLRAVGATTTPESGSRNWPHALASDTTTSHRWVSDRGVTSPSKPTHRHAAPKKRESFTPISDVDRSVGHGLVGSQFVARTAGSGKTTDRTLGSPNCIDDHPDEGTSMIAINGSTAVVTGERCGLGKELAAQLLSRSATAVGTGARRPPDGGAVPIPVDADVTRPDSVTALADTTGCFRSAARAARAPAPTRSLHRTDG
jgi:hypothetical protein